MDDRVPAAGRLDTQCIPISLRPKHSLIERADAYLYELEDGSSFLDFSAQTLNLPIGQPNESIISAVTQQLGSLSFASSRFGSRPFVELSNRLVDLAPPQMKVANCKLCDGSDAVETCLKVGSLYQRSKKVLALPRAWHGETISALGLCSLTRSEYIKGSEDVHFSDTPYIESLTELADKTTEPSTIILDPIGFSIGLFSNDDEFIQNQLHELYRISVLKGHFLIFDEIQTFGFFPNGLFYSSNYHTPSNAIAVGKALGCGFPVAAALYDGPSSQVVRYNEAEFTFGGQPPACAAAAAFLDFYADNSASIKHSFNNFMRFSSRIDSQFGDLFETRQIGFFLALHPRTKHPKTTSSDIYGGMMRSGIICRVTDFGHALMFKSAINAREDDYNQCFERLSDVIENERSKQYLVVGYNGRKRRVAYDPAQLSTRVWKRDKLRARIPPYISRLLKHFPGIKGYVRKFPEQVKIANELQRIGLPVPEHYVTDGILYQTHIDGIGVDSFLKNCNMKNLHEIEALFSQLVDYIDHAHINRLPIGDRWPGNSVWDGETLYFIDFEIGYRLVERNRQLVWAFEAFFALFQHLAHVSDPLVRFLIIDKYVREFRRSHPNHFEEMMQQFWNFYSSYKKPRNPSSLPYNEYANTMIQLAQTFQLVRKLAARAQYS